jgi:hypothetical protein
MNWRRQISLMDLKSLFITEYIETKLRMHFRKDVFLSRGDISLSLADMTLKELDGIYVQRGIKDGVLDNRSIEIRENDIDSYLVTLSQARKRPDNWDLTINCEVPVLKKVWPVPLAQDTGTDKMLILDSNHLMVNVPQDWQFIPAK